MVSDRFRTARGRRTARTGGWCTDVRAVRGRCTGMVVRDHAWRVRAVRDGRVRADRRTARLGVRADRQYVVHTPYAVAIRRPRTRPSVPRGAGPYPVRGRAGVRGRTRAPVRTGRTAYPPDGPVRSVAYGIERTAGVVRGFVIRDRTARGVRGRTWQRPYGVWVYGGVRGRRTSGWRTRPYGVAPYGWPRTGGVPYAIRAIRKSAPLGWLFPGMPLY
jgi:hypothetical protein